ncbi:MAG: hypothetical protein AAFR11_03745 [Pseudomonadota bacterium]
MGSSLTATGSAHAFGPIRTDGPQRDRPLHSDRLALEDHRANDFEVVGVDNARCSQSVD